MRSRTALTVSVEDYLKCLCVLGDALHKPLTNGAIASFLGVSPPSVTGALQRLSRQGLVAHVPYRGARLTPEGEKIALSMVRKHRLLESHLHASLHVPLHEVHEEAERLEHGVSDALLGRIADSLGHPTHTPLGAPIPTEDGRWPKRAQTAIFDLPPESEGLVSQIAMGAGLEQLLEGGLYPQSHVRLGLRDEEGNQILHIAPPVGSQSGVWSEMKLPASWAKMIFLHGEAAELLPPAGEDQNTQARTL